MLLYNPKFSCYYLMPEAMVLGKTEKKKSCGSDFALQLKI